MKKKKLIAINKIDILKKEEIENLKSFNNFILISCKTRENIDTLIKNVYELLKEET